MKQVSFSGIILSATIIVMAGQPAMAQSWLDKLKARATEEVEGLIDSESGNATEAAAKEVTTPPATTNNSSGKSSPSKPVVPSGNSYADSYGSTTYLTSIWPYDGVTGKPVRDVEIRGVHLGQPLPEAEKALINKGFSRGNGLHFQRIMYELNGKRDTVSRDEYYKMPSNARGNIIRSMVVELEAITPSAAIIKELLPYPVADNGDAGLSTDEQQRCEQYKTGNRLWARGLSVNEYRELRTKCRQYTSGTQQKKQEPLYVSRIWFGQKFISGEKVDYDLFKQKAKETFGEPTYANTPQTQYAGAAYNDRGKMWYLDSALTPKARIRELLEKSGDDDRPMIFKDFIHPGNASNAYYIRAYQNSFNDMIEALRIAYAPHMSIGYDRGAFAVDAQWPFLKNEKSYRELWEKQKARAAQPEAEITF